MSMNSEANSSLNSSMF